jgi:hypothetical protein
LTRGKRRVDSFALGQLKAASTGFARCPAADPLYFRKACRPVAAVFFISLGLDILLVEPLLLFPGLAAILALKSLQRGLLYVLPLPGDAFVHFGGVPKTLVINLKAAVAHPNRFDPHLSPRPSAGTSDPAGGAWRTDQRVITGVLVGSARHSEGLSPVVWAADTGLVPQAQLQGANTAGGQSRG